MKGWTAVLAAMSVVASGCTGLVLDPSKDGNGSSAAPGGGTPGGGAAPTALAMRYGAVAALHPFPVTGPTPPDPDALVLFFSNQPQTCSDPLVPPFPFDTATCDGSPDRWQAVLLVPPALDRPGLVDLSDTRTMGYAQELLEGGCGGGNGYGIGWGGTLEILSSDAAAVTLRLRDGVHAMSTVIDGEYVAQRCDAPPPPAPPLAAIALHGGTGGDPSAIQIVAGNVTETCQDPWSSIDCKNAWRLSFTLPASLQQPGLYDLSSPALAAALTTSASPVNPPCAAEVHGLSQGTVEIVSVDASGVTFAVSGSRSYDYGAQLTADGLYRASFCP